MEEKRKNQSNRFFYVKFYFTGRKPFSHLTNFKSLISLTPKNVIHFLVRMWRGQVV